MKLKVKKLHPAARLPVYASLGAACFDLHAIDEGRPHPRDPHAAIFRTGLAFEVPDGWGMLIYSRSGQGFKDAIRLSNCTGIIDSDYRGEVQVALRFDGNDEMRCPKVRVGDRIAQALVLPVPRVDFEVAEQLSTTERGTDGFGSTDQGDGSETDPLYKQALLLVTFTKKTSISYVQAHLQIGYNRAARLLESMEKAGYLSPMDSSGQRSIIWRGGAA